MIREAFALARFMLGHPIGRRRPLRCALDTLRWQLTAGPSPKAVPFVGEARLWARRGETGVTGNLYVGLHEFADMAFVLHALRPGDLFLDVGANAGSYTVLAAKVAGAEAIAVEPVPETVARLRANLELNGIGGRVRVVEAAVGEHAGEAWFTVDHDTTNHVVLGETAEPGCIRVPVLTIDQVVGDRTPVLAKIDVEGHDAAALAGARGLLERPELTVLVVETDARRAEADSSAARLRAAGFRPMAYDPFTRRLEDRPAAMRSANALFVRHVETVRERLRTAPPVTVKGLSI